MLVVAIWGSGCMGGRCSLLERKAVKNYGPLDTMKWWYWWWFGLYIETTMTMATRLTTTHTSVLYLSLSNMTIIWWIPRISLTFRRKRARSHLSVYVRSCSHDYGDHDARGSLWHSSLSLVYHPLGLASLAYSFLLLVDYRLDGAIIKVVPLSALKEYMSFLIRQIHSGMILREKVPNQYLLLPCSWHIFFIGYRLWTFSSICATTSQWSVDL